MQSDFAYAGPGAYVNIVSAGPLDDPTFFRLYVGQGMNVRHRLQQHHGTNHRKLHPSLQYSVLGEGQRVLISIVFATFSHLGIEQQETLDLLLNLVEKLGTLLFQTLPAPTLAQFLPGFVNIEHPNVHLNVLSPLFQSRDGNDQQSSIDEALGYLKDSEDPYIHKHYLLKAKDNPLLTVILQLALENKGHPPLSYDGLPGQLRRYLERQGFPDADSVQALVYPGRTLIQAIHRIMSDRGREAQAAMGYPSLAAGRLKARDAQGSEALDSEGRNLNLVPRVQY